MKISTDNGGLYGLSPSVSSSAQRIENRNSEFGFSSRGSEALLDRVEVSEVGSLMARVLEASDAQRAGEIASLNRLYATGSLQVDPLELSRSMITDAVDNGRLGGA